MAPRVLVPTMGALHEGHGALIRAGAALGEVTVSIFVNPTQFDSSGDWARYPKMVRADEAYARAEGAAAVWRPTLQEVYPKGPEATADPGPLGEVLEGAARPGHFAGVLTVVGRLFDLHSPDVAVFGEKDWQQLVLVRALARSRGGPGIESVPTVRDDDGLALSTRNARLSEGERSQALALPRALAAVAREWRKGERGAAALRAKGLGAAGNAAPCLDYLEVLPRALLPRIEVLADTAIAVAAGRFGATRLIDNRPL